MHLLDIQRPLFLALGNDAMHIVGDTRWPSSMPWRLDPGTDDPTALLVTHHGRSPRLGLRDTLSSEQIADRPDRVTVGRQHHRPSVRAFAPP